MRTQPQKIAISKRVELIRQFPCFISLSDEQAKELGSLFSEIAYQPNEKIVSENELVDSVYIIVAGEAEVTRELRHKKKIQQSPVAVLSVGEGIGLNDTGFYSTTGKRTATVTALTKMTLIRLDIKDLYTFLKKHHLELSMYAASEQMLRVRFIKQSLPFAKLSHERLRWLANCVEEKKIAAGEIIFQQGDIGANCYLIRAGEVEISSIDSSCNQHHLATLRPPVLFGEATLITHAPRNATAKALIDTELLVLRHEHLSELIESEGNVANMFMTLMIDRSRPRRNDAVTVHHRQSADGQDITVLKNSENGTYFKLSREGAFIWERLDGEQTLQEITLDLAEKYNIFAPDTVAALISKLSKSGFIANIDIDEVSTNQTQPLWVRATLAMRKILEIRYAFGDADSWITKMYQRYVHYLFSTVGKIILLVIAVIGFSIFVSKTSEILLFFNQKHASLLLLLAVIPLSLLAVILHELGHAFAVKAFGREVHYIGVGWYWFGPIAFTDTSDMWLADRKARMAVNLAGVCVDLLVAAVATIMLLLIQQPYIQATLWLFALYNYIGAFRMLSPLQEMDGYYVLMDWLEKPKLRQSAVVWLVKKMPQCLRKPTLFREYRAEATYWIACIVFLVLVTILTLVVQSFVFTALGMKPANPYLTLLLPLAVVLFSSLSIIADIRQKSED
jgi:putative peptide zinc metalloprotease protein